MALAPQSMFPPNIRRRFPLRMYEILAITNLVAVHLFLARTGMAPPFGEFIDTLATYVPQFLILIALGIAVRTVRATFSGALGPWLARLRRWRWWIETLRLTLAIGLVLHAYAFVKVLLPLATSRQADALLWEIDRALLFGHSPSVLFLELFSGPTSLRLVDWTYEHLFQWSLYGAIAFGLSSPSNRLRVALTSAMSWLWVCGGWLYYTLPSLGPIYAFPEIWAAHEQYLIRSRHLQSELLRNFTNVLHTARTGQPRPIHIMYGIAAFPSLHVAFQSFLALFAARAAPRWTLTATLIAGTIFLGSVVTGWHYLVDAVAGVIMAIVCSLAISRTYRLPRHRQLIEMAPRFS